MTLRIAIRCDGGAAIGAGHVGRCVPIANELRERGADVTFAGAYDGIAAWLLERSGFTTVAAAGPACGLYPGDWAAATIDLYVADGVGEICALAEHLPIATIGEATRCPTSGIWIDYHVGSPAESGPRRLGGPAYAPLDPRFAEARRARHGVHRILVSTGASALFADISTRMVDAVAAAFPKAELLAPAGVATSARATVTPLEEPFDLAELAPTVDLAVIGAGMTTYELASAGIPIVAVGLVENQRVVIDGCRSTGLALTVDGIGRDPLPDVAAALSQMQEPELRAELSSRGVATFDGQGAGRVADALLAAWTPGSDADPAR